MGKRKTATRAQTADAPRRAKRPRSLDAQLRSCSGAGAVGQAQIRSPFAKRRGDHLLDCCSKRPPPSWGSKRARSAAPSCRPPPHGSSPVPDPSWRDWRKGQPG
ncbi:Os07g0572500 [Oryza sativa Japonica Group]|uniref:Os07g0572500 protein n=1 Tax=Oryza sativa subsp. japonica TaxID=39947 RepID=A0A0P0X8L0_ORYSJ|nr:hypothetical protein EE612_040194 [Oryza sativa]BAT02249.1 Os07g0572500 [Oryza sativa Japonica Group]